MQFGPKQLKNPTPTNAVWWMRIYTVVMGVFVSWMPTVSFISHKFQDIVTPILVLTITIGNAILPFFGVETHHTSVPIKDVTSMDDTKKT